MKRNIATVAVVIVIALAIAGNALAGTRCSSYGKGDKCHNGKDGVMNQLNLAADQKTRLEQAKTAHREEMTALRNMMKEKRRELRDALAKPGTTRQQVEPIVTEIKKLEASMIDKRVDGIFTVKEILTPEQFSRLESMKKDKIEYKKIKRGI